MDIFFVSQKARNVKELYGAFAVEKRETARKNQIYVYMPNMIFRLK